MRPSTSAETYEHLSATLADSMTHGNSSAKSMHESEEKPKKSAVSAGETQGQGSTRDEPQEEPGATTEIDEPTPKKLNINTYKVHSLGDYASTIRQFGTTDSYSTVIVSDSSIIDLEIDDLGS